MVGLVQDLRYGLRRLNNRPGLNTMLVITLALGIAANTVMFSGLNAVLLRAFPFANWIGIALGSGGSLILARLISSLLLGMGTHDPTTFCSIAFIIAIVACLRATGHHAPG